MLRDYLNEFELDWAQAAARSKLIPAHALKNKKILLIGGQTKLLQALAWSFLAWNDSASAGVRVQEAEFRNGRIQISRSFGEPDAPVFEPKEADYVILTGYCCREDIPDAAEETAYFERFADLLDTLARMSCRRVVLLSDGRVYGKLPYAFAASEYEAGETDPAAAGYEAQYFLQALEGLLTARARRGGFAYEILRTGLIFGACIPMMRHMAAILAEKTAKEQEIRVTLSPRRVSYVSIHDVLTAVQFVLTRCPENKIFNVTGPDCDASEGEIAMLLYRNFPQQCRLRMEALGNDSWRDAQTAGTAAEKQGRVPRPEAAASGPAETPAQRGAAGRGGMPEAAASEPAETRIQWGTAGRNGIPEAGASGSAETPAQRGAAGRNGVPEAAVSGPAESREQTPGVLLNTQLLCHYDFVPSVSLEDGLIILVKYLENTGEVFIFDNTYLGKLDTVHQILLGYLLEIDRICRKHNIKYFLAGGTLLGAIRHHGFIPWDDDADVMMLREDYDHFLEVVRDELPDNIFLQLPQTERGNYNPFTKLRINDTMFATKFTGHFMTMHNGIFFDVLSHDRTGNHRWSQKLHLMATMLARSIVFNKWGNTNIKSGGSHPAICWIVSRLKHIIPMPFALRVQNCMLTFFKNRSSDYLYDGMGRNLKRGSFPAKWLDEVIYVDFEGCKLPVPKEYDRYLTWLYGDYMQMIPVSRRRTSHSIVLTDLGAYSSYRCPAQEPEPGAEKTKKTVRRKKS